MPLDGALGLRLDGVGAVDVRTDISLLGVGMGGSLGNEASLELSDGVEAVLEGAEVSEGLVEVLVDGSSVRGMGSDSP